MLNKRAYAATVVLPDGRLWILGGAGPSAILDTSEFIKVSKIFFSAKHLHNVAHVVNQIVWPESLI